MIQLLNKFLISLIKINHNVYLDQNYTCDSTFPNFLIAFCIMQKASDTFSANSAAAYRSFFAFIADSTAFCISCT